MTKSEREIYELRLDNLDRVLASMTTELSIYKQVISAVRKMREAQKQWGDGDPFDCTEIELAKKMCEAEKEVDEYLKKMKE